MSGIERRLEELRGQGIKVWIDGDKLRVRAPHGVLAREITAELKRRKAEIMALLNPLPAITVVPDQQSYPLSPAQRRLWILSQMTDGSCAYNIPLHQFLRGSLDREALTYSLTQVVARHQSLRTTFISVEGEPRQIIHRPKSAEIEFRDLSHESDPESAARQLGSTEARKPFDLESGPLLRAVLLKIAEDAHVLLFTMHHIIADGISIAVLGRDLSHFYCSALSGDPIDLPLLEFGYRDFAVWQNRLLAGDALAGHRLFWHEHLAGHLPVLNLQTDFPRPPLQTYVGKELSFCLPRELTDQLTDFCRRSSASLFMLLHAALKVLLHVYSGQDDIIIGTASAGRDQLGLKNQIGFYLNTIALRSKIEPDQSFREFFQAVTQTTAQAFDHQIYPFDQLLGELQLRRDLSRFPLFDVMLVLQSQEEPGLAMDQLIAEPVFEHHGTSKFDLTFCFKEASDGLILSIEYNTDLFMERRIRRMGGHFMTLMECILANPEQPVGRLHCLSPDETALINEFSAARETVPVAVTFLDLFQLQVLAAPDAVAITTDQGVLTYKELDSRSNQLARYLRTLGVEAEILVGICMDRDLDLIVALIAVMKAGGAYVPLDPTYPPKRLSQVLEDGAPLLVLVDAFGKSHIAGICSDIPRIELGAKFEPWRAFDSDKLPDGMVRLRQLAYVIYTSGSTGTPKGVMVEHAGLANLLLTMRETLGADSADVFLGLTTIAFDIAGLELFLPLICGARLVLSDYATSRDPQQLRVLIGREAVSVVQATPSTWRMLVDSGWEGSRRIKALCGGEGLSSELAANLVKLTGRIWNVYGPTETTIWSSVCQIDGKETGKSSVVSIGRPVANTSIYILDAFGNPVPVGIAGELYIAGEGVGRGYRNNPQLTEAKFIPDTICRRFGSKMFRTGDLGRWREDGKIDFLGRNDLQVKIRGFRIEPAEIEAALVALPDIIHAAVDARPDEFGEQHLLAWYVQIEQSQLSPGEIRRELSEKLPEYMIPSSFFPIERLPLTPNGKVDRTALRGSPSDGIVTEPYEPPTTRWESLVAGLWKELLNVPRVGRRDNFFALGGHSLKATQFVAKFNRDAAARLELIDLFRSPDLEKLAALLEERELAGFSEPSKMASAAVRPISPITDQELEMLND